MGLWMQALSRGWPLISTRCMKMSLYLMDSLFSV
jgi:hypothetical protein